MQVTEPLTQRFGQQILVGEETINEVGAAARSVCPTAHPRVLLLSTTPPSGPPTIQMLGLEAAALSSLQAHGVRHVRPCYDVPLEGVVPAINRVCRLVDEEKINVIVSVAGSSGEDTAELVKLVVNQGVRPFDAWNYARGRSDGKAPLSIDDDKPDRVCTVSYNTTVLTGSPTSPFAVMLQPDTLEKVSAMHLEKLRPQVTLISMQTLRRLPRWYLVLGAFDTLAHLLAGYLSRLGGADADYSLSGRGVPIRAYTFEGLSLVRDHLAAVARDPCAGPMEPLVAAALAGGRAIAVGTGPEHLGAHGYGRIGHDGAGQQPLAHCAAVAALLVPVLDEVFHHCVTARHVEGLTKFAHIAQAMDRQPQWDYEGYSGDLAADAERGVTLINNLVWDVYEAAGMEPVTLRSLGVRQDQVGLGLSLWDQMANCHKNSPPYDHTRDSVLALFQRAWDYRLARRPV